MMDFLNGAPVLVLGLGESGLAMARWCDRFGARVRVWDTRESPPNGAALAAALPDAVWVRGPLSDEAFADVQLVLKSPGLSPRDGRIREPLQRIVATGVPVQGELDLFAQALAGLKAARGYAPKVLAITGTNGKTTTTSMAAQLIARAGWRVAVAGNIGPTMLQTLMDALELELEAGRRPHPSPLPKGEGATPARSSVKGEGATPAGSSVKGEGATPASSLEKGEGATPASSLVKGEGATPTAAALLPSPSGRGTEGEGGAPQEPVIDSIDAPVLPPAPPLSPTFAHLPDVWVLELSSFQLDAVQSFEPSAAAVLNLTEDHLDWHGSMADYSAAKQRVFGQQSVMVINRDDPLVEALVPAADKSKATKGRKPATSDRTVVRFGLDAPRRPGDFGVVEENGIAWLVRARELDETLKRSKGGKGLAAAEAEEIHIQRLMPADALRVRGRHNAANALAALALATAIDCPLAPMLHALREYQGEPHRLQFIASVDGIDAFDDSKGTNVGATVAALNGLGVDRSPAKLAVIMGGDGKGQDFAPLLVPVRRHARAVALIGRDAAAIEQVLAASAVPLQRHDSLEAATRWCFEQAQIGDAVLLSPACASLDMFRDYGHRAEVFVAEVLALASDAGEIAA